MCELAVGELVCPLVDLSARLLVRELYCPRVELCAS